jgi:hypothetical protein
MSTLVLPLTTAEAQNLAALLQQFLDLLQDDDTDPAVARLTPDPYPDDAEAAAEFRSVTRDDLLDRRRDDAQRLLAQLATVADLEADPTSTEDDPELAVVLDERDVQAWLRTLTALRLVIATRLGIVGEDRHDESDARYGVYDWLGYRLELLLRSLP